MRLTERRRLKAFLQTIFKKEGKIIENLVYVFCSDKYLLKINKNFLKHDFYTDTITFNFSENFTKIEGEVYISIDRVKENANRLKINTQLEILRIVFHGALHLCGYLDKTKAQKKEISKKEDEYLLLYSTFHVKRTSLRYR